MEARGHGVEEKETYTVLRYRGPELPASYTNVILTHWLRSLRYGNDYFKLVNSDDYFKAYDKYLKTILAKPETSVRLAVLSDEKDVVLGWSVSEADTLHYVWVRQEQRNQGIARSLVPKGITTITHLTKSAMNIWQTKVPYITFNPFKG